MYLRILDIQRQNEHEFSVSYDAILLTTFEELQRTIFFDSSLRPMIRMKMSYLDA